MTRMEWAIDVPQKLLQSDAILTLYLNKVFYLHLNRGTGELIIKKSCKRIVA